MAQQNIYQFSEVRKIIFILPVFFIVYVLKSVHTLIVEINFQFLILLFVIPKYSFNTEEQYFSLPYKDINDV